MSLAGQILPIFLLVAIGAASRVWLAEAAVDGLRQIVVRLVLPAVLFLSFLDMTLEARFAPLVGVVFAVCAAALAVGIPAARRLTPDLAYAPFLTAGYEFGMLGLSLFAGAYGVAALPTLAVVGLGHELFIWFVFFALLIARRDGVARPADLVRRFVSNPVILAIVAGIGLNAVGLHSRDLAAVPGLDAVVQTLRFLAATIVPLVLLVVGHGLRFDGLDRARLGRIGRIVGLRLAIQLPLAVVASLGGLGWLLGFDTRFQVALFALMILPPPFIIPLFMPASAATERRLVVQVLALHTVVSLAAFAAIIAAFPRF
jgi:predicted permease